MYLQQSVLNTAATLQSVSDCPAEYESISNSAEQPSKVAESEVDLAKQTANEPTSETAEAASVSVDPLTARVNTEEATAQPSAVSTRPAVAPVLPGAPTAVAGHVALDADSAPHTAADNSSEPAVAALQVSASTSEAAVVEPEPAMAESEPAVALPELAVVMPEPVAAAEPAVIESESAVGSLESHQDMREAILVRPGAGVTSVEDSLEVPQEKQMPSTGRQQLSNTAAVVDALVLHILMLNANPMLTGLLAA